MSHMLTISRTLYVIQLMLSMPHMPTISRTLVIQLMLSMPHVDDAVSGGKPTATIGVDDLLS